VRLLRDPRAYWVLLVGFAIFNATIYHGFWRAVWLIDALYAGLLLGHTIVRAGRSSVALWGSLYGRQFGSVSDLSLAEDERAYGNKWRRYRDACGREEPWRVRSNLFRDPRRLDD
jgi:hypothetical protein